MRKPTVTCEPFDVVVPFPPFPDSSRTKRRPALVLSPTEDFGEIIGHTLLAMVTSQNKHVNHNLLPLNHQYS